MTHPPHRITPYRFDTTTTNGIIDNMPAISIKPMKITITNRITIDRSFLEESHMKIDSEPKIYLEKNIGVDVS